MATQPQTGDRTEQISIENQNARDVGQGGDEQIRGRQPAPEFPSDDPSRSEPERREPKFVNSKHEDKRARIIAESRELRAEQAANPDLAEEIAESRRRRFSDTTEQPSIRQDEPETVKPVPGAKRTLKVLGKDIEVTEEDLIAHAQKSLAAGDLLDQAKRDRALAQSVLETVTAAAKPAAADAGTPAAEKPSSRSAAPDATSATKLTAEDYAKLVDAIQVGNPEEALAALQKYGDDVAERAVQKVLSSIDSTIATQVRTINDVDERVEQTRSALKTIADENPELNQSRLKQRAFATATAEVMRENMIANGVQADKLDQLIRDSNAPEDEVIAYAYRSLIEKGNKLPEHHEVVKSAVELMRKDGMLPARQNPSPRPAPDNTNRSDLQQQRLERKREIAPQPRRVGAIPSTEVQDQNRGDRGLAAVRQMRAARRGR